MTGDMIRSRKLVPGYFAQHQLEELDGAMTPIQTLAKLRPKLTEQEVRSRLGGFGFSADKARTLVGNLSGGERARLMLALATLDKPNLLLLDEPTNHLDIDAREQLLSALNDFEGAVVLISHDRRLIEATSDRLLLVANGGVEPFDGDLDDYRRFLLSGDNTPTRREEPAPKINKEEARREAADRRRQLKPLKDKVEIAEHQIAELDGRDQEIRCSPRRSAAVHARSAERQRRLQEAGRRRAQTRKPRKRAGWPSTRNMNWRWPARKQPYFSAARAMSPHSFWARR